MRTNIQYYGIFIDEESRNKLKRLVPQTAYKVYCDHMTLAHCSKFTDDIVNACNELLGKEFTITATTIGKSNDAMAVGIETDCFSINDHKHITLCTLTPSSKPVQSNYIQNWVKLKTPIVLRGTVMGYTNNGLVKENKHMSKKLIRLTEQDLHRIVKESLNRILKEYTGNPSYTDANAPANRPPIGTPEYYTRNDRMRVGQEPIYNNPDNWDKADGWNAERNESQPYNGEVEEGANGMDALAEYKAAIEQHKNVLRRMIPNLPFYSPEQRAEIEAEMAKYGINPRG